MTVQRFAHGYALLIAVSDNQIPAYALPAVARDAAALRAVLVNPERCAYLPENVRLVQGRDASRAGIRAGLAWLRQKLAADQTGNATAVVFYSGHGAYDRDTKTYYLLPFDLRQPIIQSLIPAADIAAEIEQVRPQRLLVMLDCCHAGGMGIKGEELLDTEGLIKAAAPARTPSVVTLMEGQGRAVLSSSTASESSYVRADRSMSIFTYHLVEALTGHAQPEGATEVLVSDIMSYVSRAVPQSARREYGVSQTPVYDLSGENFPVALLLGGRGTKDGDAPEPLADIGAGRTNGSAAGKYAMSGDFRGAIINIESTLTNVTQQVLAAPVGDATWRADLNSLLAALQTELERVPPARREDVEAVVTRAARLGKALSDGDEELMQLSGRALTRAAGSLGDVDPVIPATAGQIAAATERLAVGLSR